MSIDGLAVDWLHFVNEQHVSFLNNEIEPLRKLTPQIPCTTNFMGTHGSSNYWEWSKSLDLISNDIYPLHEDRENSWRKSLNADFIHSLMRGMAGGEPWIVMECSPSSVNWAKVNKLKRPGVNLQEALQAVANGADVIHYFQWRKGRGGFEKYHGAVVDHAGSDQTRVFKECESLGRELEGLASIAGQPLERALVAMIYDWESRWALQSSAGPNTLGDGNSLPCDRYNEACLDHFRALRSAGIEVDLISTDSEFSKYSVIVTPALYSMNEETALRLTSFAKVGGTWLATYLTGYVDDTNRCWRGGFPGSGLRQVFGLWNEEIDWLFDDEKVSVKGVVCGKDGVTEALDVVEHIHAEGAEVLAVAGSEFYAGAPPYIEK